MVDVDGGDCRRQWGAAAVLGGTEEKGRRKGGREGRRRKRRRGKERVVSADSVTGVMAGNGRQKLWFLEGEERR